MSDVTATLPVVLVVGLTNSIHTARWVNTVRQAFRVVLFPSVLGPVCVEFEPARVVHTRAGACALAAGEVGVYPQEAIEVLSQAELDDPESYPYAEPATATPLHLMPRPDALERAIRALSPDLVHSMELQHGGYLVSETRRRFGRRFPAWIASSWGSDIFLYRRLRRHRPLLRRLLRAVDSLHSDCARDFGWAALAGFAGTPFPQMPASGGVDFSAFPHPRDLQMPSERTTILVKGYHGWSGRGLHILLALHLIAPHLRGFRIVVTHSGKPMVEMVEQLAGIDGLDIHVEGYLNSSDEVIARLATARVAVGFGISDGISTTLLEAMAVGTFMIQASTCCGGEWITHGRTGLLVAPHDVVALSEAILLAVSNDELVDGAVAVNREVVERRWNAAVNGTVIADAYHALIAARSHG